MNLVISKDGYSLDNVDITDTILCIAESLELVKASILDLALSAMTEGRPTFEIFGYEVFTKNFFKLVTSQGLSNYKKVYLAAGQPPPFEVKLISGEHYVYHGPQVQTLEDWFFTRLSKKIYPELNS